MNKQDIVIRFKPNATDWDKEKLTVESVEILKDYPDIKTINVKFGSYIAGTYTQECYCYTDGSLSWLGIKRYDFDNDAYNVFAELCIPSMPNWNIRGAHIYNDSISFVVENYNN